MAGSERKRLLNDASWQVEIDALKSFICSEVVIDNVRVPRFGVHSLYAKNMPFFAYDDPDFLAKFGATAFTDGTHCFFAVPFLEKIMEDMHGQNGMVFLALHEVSHPLFRHFNRNLDVPHAIANQAQDLSINTRMLKDFVKNSDSSKNILHPLPKILSIGCGFEDGDIEKYSTKSEEDIARQLMKEAKNSPKQGKGPGVPGAPGMPGSGSPGQGDPGEAGMGTDHRVSTQDLIDALEANGLGHIVDILKLPKTPEEIAKKQEIQMSDVMNAVNKMANIKAQLGDRMPGSHNADAAKEIVGDLLKPKISWKLSTKDAIFGNGMKFKQSFDHAHEVYHFDLTNVGLPDRIYDGAHIPSKPSGFVIALLDTSGSMTLETDIRAAVSEIFGLVTNNKQNAPDVILLCADTVGRGTPLVITPQNVDKILAEQVKVDGRGGTDLTQGINDALEHPEVKKRLKAGQKINSMLFFTDLGDRPPARADLPDALPRKFFFMAVPGTYNDSFAKAVSDYADTVSMGNRMTLDLDANTDTKPKRRVF